MRILRAGSQLSSLPFLVETVFASRCCWSTFYHGPVPQWTPIDIPRGGTDHSSVHIDSSTEAVTETTSSDRVLTLDEKVHAAMRKLGLEPPAETAEEIKVRLSDVDDERLSDVDDVISDISSSAGNGTNNCLDGVCQLPSPENSAVESNQNLKNNPATDPGVLAERISQTMQVDLNMAWAALGATSVATENNTRVYNEKAAGDMIQMELDMIAQIQEDSEDVQLLVAEGFDSFFVRRALAFAERNIDDARAILFADKMDEEEEEEEEDAAAEAAQASRMTERKSAVEANFKTVEVDAGFDPTKLGMQQPERSLPRPASRDSVIFEASVSQIQELVLESPVPVLLDIYADWCGPCKALSPILEDMAVKSGGTLRLVKVNSDNERSVSQALEVTALPTIFGIRDGKILHMFRGMPKSEEMMKNFLMGLLIPGHAFNPPVSTSEQQKYVELSTKLIKVATAASLSFSTRERLQDLIASRIEDLVEQTGNVLDAEQSVLTMRSLLSNIIQDPYEMKFRTVNLSNKVIASKVAQFPACIAILRSVGFSSDGSNLIIGKSKAFVNIAPLSAARDAFDKWIDRTRYEVAREARKRRDEEDRVRVQAELAAQKKQDMEAPMEEAVEELDPNVCLLKFRIDGKKRVHETFLQADDPLNSILTLLPDDVLTGDRFDDKGEIQITCVAKRLVVKSTDQDAMKRSLRDHGLVPTASIVIKLPTFSDSSLANNGDEISPAEELKSASTKLADRAATKKKLKKGTHTMQSIGIYSTEDNAKGELIDGGGGTWYEQDVSDDEEENPSDESIAKEDESDAPSDHSPNVDFLEDATSTAAEEE